MYLASITIDFFIVVTRFINYSKFPRRYLFIELFVLVIKLFVVLIINYIKLEFFITIISILINYNLLYAYFMLIFIYSFLYYIISDRFYFVSNYLYLSYSPSLKASSNLIFSFYLLACYINSLYLLIY